MKSTLLILLLLLMAVPTVLASVTNDVNIKNSGGTSTVRINNQLGTSTNTTNTYSSTTKTNVEIHQTGEGTSKVNINGKEWKLEGPGDISVSEESTPKPSSSPSASPTATASPSPSPQDSTEAQKNVISQIINALQQLIERLKNLI